MKIAMVGQKGIPCTFGGVERYTEEVATYLSQKGHQVVVYTRPYYTDKNLSEYKGVKLVSLPTIKTKHLDAIFHSFLATLHALLIERVQVIHFVNIGPGFWTWLPLVLRPSVKRVGKFESMDWNHKKWGAWARASLKLGAWSLCKFSHEVIAVSSEIKDYIKFHYGLEVPVVSNGFTVKEPLAPEEVEDGLHSLDLVANKFFFTASRLVRHKGIHYLIEAFKTVKDNGIAEVDKDLELVIAGEGFHTDDYVEELKVLAGGRSDIRFLGFKSGKDLQVLFEGAKAFVQPSEAEGMSMGLIEALGYSKAVIASDIAPNLEAAIAENGDTRAILFKSKSIDDLAAKIKYVLEEDLTEFGQSCQLATRNKYNWDKVAGEIEQILAN